MCIRDRRRSRPVRAAGEQGDCLETDFALFQQGIANNQGKVESIIKNQVSVKPPGFPSVGGAGRKTGAGVAPVSYTHLRAHETVLDLECRLLLEKKKREKKII